jgi:hypothetical protein
MPLNRQQKFIGEIKTLGLARTNRFEVEMTPPGGATTSLDRMLLFCSSTSIPGINLASAANRTYGETREVVYDRMYEPMNMTFHVDRKMTVKTIFDNWINTIINPSNRKIGYYSEYTCQIKIKIQDVDEKATYIIYLNEAYPKTITAIDLNAADDNDTQRLAVSFAYRNWNVGEVQENYQTGLLTSAGGFDSYIDDFQGFQEKFRKGLGEAGNYMTGNVGKFATKSFSHFSSITPTIKF